MRRENWQVRTVLVLIAIMLGAWAITGLVIKPQIRIMGREAEEMPQIEPDSPWRVNVEFAGVETISGEGLAWDELTLRPEDEEPTLLSFYGWPVLVDYWWMGRWYTIDEHEQYYLIRWGNGDSRDTKELELRFPNGLFGRRGLYRVRLTVQRWKTGELLEAGGCTFWVDKPTHEVEGTWDNDFESWYKLDDDDFIDEHISLSFKGSYIYEGAQPHLVFGLTCDRDFFYYGTDTMRVDMLWQGNWYTVSAPFADRLISTQEGCVPGQEYIRTREIPQQVLKHKGKYRLYWGGVAYCEFTVR